MTEIQSTLGFEATLHARVIKHSLLKKSVNRLRRKKLLTPKPLSTTDLLRTMRG